MANDGSVVIDVELNTGKAKNQYDQFGNELETRTSKLKSIALGLGAAAAAGIAALATGAIAVGKAAVDAYADYEQLVGGVDTLFKGASKTVQGFADEAYKTAGMSANEYMETVTGFSASLIQSLGGDTEKAANVANQALTDMADNSNKMGTSMESIKYAYQGFAKQNYTMLDNLKLGYGGTKTEMERLLKDAEKFSGVKYDLSSFADVTEAIHVIQTEMGITGTTAKEAAQTISGSIASTKAAFKNLITGLGDSNADLEKLVQNVVESATNVVRNLIPVLINIGKSMVIVVGLLSKEIASALWGILPQGFRERVETIAKAFQSFVAPIGKAVNAAKLLAAGFAEMLINGPGERIADLREQFVKLFPAELWQSMINFAAKINDVKTGIQAVVKIVTGSISSLGDLSEFLGGTFDATGEKRILAIGQAIKGFVDRIKEFVSPAQNASKSIDTFKVGMTVAKTVLLGFLGPIGLVIKAIELIAKILGGGDAAKGFDTLMASFQNFAESIFTYGPQLGANFTVALAGITAAIAAALPGIIAGALLIISTFITGLAQGLPMLAAAFAQLILGIAESIAVLMPSLVVLAATILTNLTAAIVTLAPMILVLATTIITTLIMAIETLIPLIIVAGVTIITSVLNGIAQSIPLVIEAAANVINAFLQSITDQLPEVIKNSANLIITWLTELNKYLPDIIQKGLDVLVSFLNGIANNIGKITDIAITIILEFLRAINDRMPEITQVAVDLIISLINGIGSMIDEIVIAASALIQGFLRGLADEVDDIVDAGMDLVDAIVDGILEVQDRLFDAAIDLINGFAENIRKNSGELRNAGENLLDALIDAVDPWGLWDKGKELVNNFVDAIESAWNGVSGWVSNLLNPGRRSAPTETTPAPDEAANAGNGLSRSGGASPTGNMPSRLGKLFSMDQLGFEPKLSFAVDFQIDDSELRRISGIEGLLSGTIRPETANNSLNDQRRLLSQMQNNQNSSTPATITINIDNVDMGQAENTDIERIARELAIRVDRESRARF